MIYTIEADVKYEQTVALSTAPATEPTTAPATKPTAPTPAPSGNIPQTGTLLWLVPVLLIAGVVLIAAGIIIRHKISK